MSTITAKKSKPTKPTTFWRQLVQFEFTAPEARAVCIAGTFNDWRPDVSPMIPLGNGRWAQPLSLALGTYEYCLVVDGEWRPDPQASETIANPFGGLNSVLKVAAPVSPKLFSKVRRAFATSA
ncbi:MAG: hypothetical protein HY736_23005 [Verrucomicrobia bacterium]|nr:hypothetical protein [Verrucomicrobiota bacterium]